MTVRTALLIAALCSVTSTAFAQQNPANDRNSSQITSPMRNGGTNSNAKTDDRTGNMNNSSGSPGSNTVGSSIVPPAGASGNTTAGRSGSGTSTSGGRDDNGDQGRDRMNSPPRR